MQSRTWRPSALSDTGIAFNRPSNAPQERIRGPLLLPGEHADV